MNERWASFWRRHRRLRWALIALLVVLAATVITVSVMLRHAEPILRAYIVSELEQHFQARVELDSFHVSLRGGLRAEGNGLRIWPPAEMDVPAAERAKPLISLDEFHFRAPLHYAPGLPIRISVVRLKGLTVDIPPKPERAPAAQKQKEKVRAKIREALVHLKVESIQCTDAHLLLESNDPDKSPLEFVIASLRLTDLEPGGTMKFQGNLTNARPVGTILTKGTFGPWTVDDPGESPVWGTYDFEHANLGDFKGIAGTLSSTGKYQGPLRKLTVDGVTDTPDFALTQFGTRVNLRTQFHATVDATNGDTWLEPVEATLGHAHFTVRGKVVRMRESAATPHTRGHDIALAVDVPHARMEDFLRLTSKTGTPLLTGWLTLKTSLEIAPGKTPARERFKLKGRFSLDNAVFTDAKIQDRVNDLSLRGQGKPKEAKDKNDDAPIPSAMQSDFTMNAGVITLPNLQYATPGADVALHGTYTVAGGGLDFVGLAKMQAPVSKMVGGWKGWLLKPADRFFKKDDAGTAVPIHINGTGHDPHFGIDFGRLKSSSPERPDEKR